jgi:hypothetical protein
MGLQALEEVVFDIIFEGEKVGRMERRDELTLLRGLRGGRLP